MFSLNTQLEKLNNIKMTILLFSRILGLCLLQNELCPITLNRHVIKVLLGRKVRKMFLESFCYFR